MQKKHAKQTKKVGLGQTPPPSMGKIPTFYRFFSGGPPLLGQRMSSAPVCILSILKSESNHFRTF